MEKITYLISSNCFVIIDSYKIVKKKEKIKLLQEIMTSTEYKKFGYNRTLKNYLSEWFVHNICYKLHIKRSSTKDANFDREFTGRRGQVEKWVYKLLEIFM